MGALFDLKSTMDCSPVSIRRIQPGAQRVEPHGIRLGPVQPMCLIASGAGCLAEAPNLDARRVLSHAAARVPGRWLCTSGGAARLGDLSASDPDLRIRSVGELTVNTAPGTAGAVNVGNAAAGGGQVSKANDFAYVADDDGIGA
ncbi:hypothetical protein [Streptomyces iconiensis]|uniref:Uncharacterized protein n=1 Tax=Streptomyces iconiensis TaxID=1384038 RepID=A0ABT7A695_9ACTN|nr:hypothetical protein [Streptomyces iconiensis]MDJ1136862.1 hypothetical protein [Streptomyces iconiensis]